MAEILAQRQAQIAAAARLPSLREAPSRKAPEEVEPIPQALLRQDPNIRMFIGAPNAGLWFGGLKSGKRFSNDGKYFTSVPSEIVELKRMYGVVEIPIGA